MTDRPPQYGDLEAAKRSNSKGGITRLSLSKAVTRPMSPDEELVSPVSPNSEHGNSSSLQQQAPDENESRRPQSNEQDQEPEAAPLIPAPARATTELPGYAEAEDPEQQPPEYRKNEKRYPGSPIGKVNMTNQKKMLWFGIFLVVLIGGSLCLGLLLRHHADEDANPARPTTTRTSTSTVYPIQPVPTTVSLAAGTSKPTDPPSLYPQTVQNNRVLNPQLYSLDGEKMFDWDRSEKECWVPRGRGRFVDSKESFARTYAEYGAGCKLQTTVRGYDGESNATQWWITMQYWAYALDHRDDSPDQPNNDTEMTVRITTTKDNILLLNTTSGSVDRSKNYTTVSWLVGISVQPFNISVSASARAGFWDVTNFQALPLPLGSNSTANITHVAQVEADTSFGKGGSA